MKYILVVFTLFCTLHLRAQSTIESLFAHYSNDKSFTTIQVTGAMLELLSDDEELSNSDNDISNLAKGLENIIVLTTEKNCMKHYEHVRTKLNVKAYKILLDIRDEEENVHIYYKSGNKGINELLVLVSSPDEFVLVNLVGTIDLAKLKKLSQQSDIIGIDQLEKLPNKGSK